MLRNILYIPLSWLYTIGVAIRHLLFDQRVIPSFTVEVPTICVGNIAVGGTGKTPMTAYIVQLLLAHGYHPAILSRGYKRRTRGFLLADTASTVDTIGDEAMQLHRAFPEVPVAVCENRVRGVHQLQRQVNELDVVVLDDAMQHRAIRCGMYVLLTPYDRLYIDDHMLPWGRLRDLPSRALKASAVVVTKCPDNLRPIDMRVVDNRLHLPTYQLLHFTGLNYAPMEQEGTPLVLCGIDIDAIVEKSKPFDFVLTTEKDIQRLRTTSLVERLAAMNKRLIALPISIRFYTPQAAFDRQILQYVAENNRKNTH